MFDRLLHALRPGATMSQILLIGATTILVFSFTASAQTLDTATPLIDGDPPNGQLYKGLHGYLYSSQYGTVTGAGSSTEDAMHEADGENLGQSIVPLCHNGLPPDPTNGCATGETPAIVAVGIGMSHWTKELCYDQDNGNFVDPSNCGAWSFLYKAAHAQGINPSLVLVDCAQDGAPATDWTMNSPVLPYDPEYLYSDCNKRLGTAPYNLTAAQVQIILYKGADSGQRAALQELPTPFTGCPSTIPSYDVCNLMAEVSLTARVVKTFYPNVKQMFLHGRSYGGYANLIGESLNPEPYAYEQSFAMKWVIHSQIGEIYHAQPPLPPMQSLTYANAPWVDWGLYMWAGATLTPCQNCVTQGLTWRQDQTNMKPCTGNQECDFQTDNTHPSYCGRDKVSAMLLYKYCTSRYTPWFRAPGGCVNVPRPTDTCNF